MAKYLDLTGLTAFWKKAKGWAEATLAAKSHTHAYSDITNPPAAYTLPDASATQKGGVKLGSDTVQTAEAAETPSSAAGRTYPVQRNGGGQMVVNVPWTDSNTTYDLSGYAKKTDIPTALKNPNKLTMGGKTYDGSEAVTVTATDLGAAASSHTHTEYLEKTGKAASATTADTATSANKVANALTLKVKTGTTEGTDLYTFNGSAAKTLDIKAGSNITLTPAQGALTIAATNTDTKYSAGTGLSLDGTTFSAKFGTTESTVAKGNHTHDTYATRTELAAKADAADVVKNTMTVKATGLAAGQVPTIAYDKTSNTLTVGIPKGDKGDTGTAGPAGARGETGAAGARGADGTGIGTITVTSDGTHLTTPTCTVTPGTVSGGKQPFTLAFKGLQGAQGAQGAKGESGAAGKSAYEIWKDQSGNGSKTETDFLASLKGAAGAKGDKGDPGTNGTNGTNGAAAGFGTPTATATALSAGATPTVSVTATGGNTSKVFAFSFGIPAGAKGADGKNGTNGTNGVTPAISATATVTNTTGTPAVTVTKTGTDAAPSFKFAFSNLKGATGATGAKGDKGDTPTIKAAAGTNAGSVGTPTVTASTSGTITTFTFDYLKGAKGDKGDAGVNATTTAVATQSANGLMSAADKKKLDGIAEGTNKYVLPAAGKSTLGGVTIGEGITVDAAGQISVSLAGLGGVPEDSFEILQKSHTSLSQKVTMLEGRIEGGDMGIDAIVDHLRKSFRVMAGAYNHSGTMTGAVGTYASVEGWNNTAKGYCAHVGGTGNSAVGECSFATGEGNTASGECSFVGGGCGTPCSATGDASFAFGIGCKAKGRASVAMGDGAVANAGQFVTGRYNVEKNGTDTVLIVANGSQGGQSNAFRVDYDGSVYGKKAYNTGGADYAEYFEWADGNPDNEDRRGLFVTLAGDRIRVATDKDGYILGIVSPNPSVAGNSPDEWHARFLKDEWGNFLKRKTAVTRRIPGTGKTGEEWETVTEEAEGYIPNPGFDERRGEYVPRSARKEWAAIGMLGVLTTRDDGTCTPDGYCRVGADGGATASDSGYRVLKRINDCLVKVLFR